MQHSGSIGQKAAALVILTAASLAAALWVGPGVANAGANEAGRQVPVLVELFTSEGCSSCPPADALLARLDATQFVPGARAIVLSEHVTYWNSLGWHDPFSFEKMTERQQDYASRLRLDSPYTPQAVVDGQAEFVGSDSRKLAAAVARAAAVSKTPLAIDQVAIDNGAVKFSVRGPVGGGMTLMAAVADDAAQSEVLRGENGGHTLHHVAVVRAIDEMGSGVGDGRPLVLKLPKEVKSSANPQLRLVVFVIERRTGHVTAVDERAIVN